LISGIIIRLKFPFAAHPCTLILKAGSVVHGG
jgi:hypothetical protein